MNTKRSPGATLGDSFVDGNAYGKQVLQIKNPQDETYGFSY